MRLPRRLVRNYHPLGLIIIAVATLALGLLLFLHDRAPFDRWWLWFGGGLALGLAWFWLMYVRFPTDARQVQRVSRGGREQIRWWWWALYLACFYAMVWFINIVGKAEGLAIIGASFGLAAGWPWWRREWRAMSDAWERVAAEEAAGANE